MRAMKPHVLRMFWKTHSYAEGRAHPWGENPDGSERLGGSEWWAGNLAQGIAGEETKDVVSQKCVASSRVSGVDGNGRSSGIQRNNYRPSNGCARVDCARGARGGDAGCDRSEE
jgi:hypothetical protein